MNTYVSLRLAEGLPVYFELFLAPFIGLHPVLAYELPVCSLVA